MDENQSDEETVEFDIEVVSSSPSASFELHSDDGDNQSIDFLSDKEREEKDAAAQHEDSQKPEEPRPPTRGELADHRKQGDHLQEVNETVYESDKKSQEEIEGAEIKNEPTTTATEQVGAESDQLPSIEGRKLLLELEHSNQPIDSQHEHEPEESEAETGGPANSEEIRATSEQQQCIEHETNTTGRVEPRTDESPQQDGADKIPIGDKTQGVDNGAAQCGTIDFLVEEQTGAIGEDAAETIVTPTVVRPSDSPGQADDLTNNQVEPPSEVNYAEPEAKSVAAVDLGGSSPEGNFHDANVVEPEMVAAEYRLISEPLECPTSWSFNEISDRSLEPANSKVPIEFSSAPRVIAAPEECLEGDAIRSEEGVAVNQKEGAECEVDVNQTHNFVDTDGQQPPDEEQSQHRMVDISVRLDEVPDIDADQAYSPSVSPGPDSDDSQHSNLSLALSHTTTTNQSSGHDAIFQQQMQHLHQQQVRRSSSAHLLSSTLEDEDLEREFDEEPEFKRRDVQVKRNRNPRDEYRLGDELGRGKFGTVVRCVEEASGRALAAKFIHMRRREDREDVEREVAIMSVLQHKRLLQLYDAFDDGRGEMCLITELVEGGELFERIVDDDFDLTEKKAAIFMRQICEGVEYMHGQQIVHLDMKPENILCLSRTGNRIKLIDFGLARRLDPQTPTRVMFGTPDFAAPEVLAYETVTLATDMWSVGVICYVLLSGLSPFMGDSDMETMANVMRATFDFNDSAFEAISDLAKDFISKLLVRDPNERLKPSECLKHAWLARGGAPLEAAIRSRRESSAVMISAHHRLALEQAAMLAAVAAAAAAAGGDQQPHTESPQTPPVTPSAGPFVARASFGAESSASSGGLYSLDKRRLKKYVVRRKWHKTVHAIMALGRMGANLRI